MPDKRRTSPRQLKTTMEASAATDASQFAGESLEGSGFENEVPDADFEWRD